MTHPNGKQLQFHPFFRVTLVQMIRHGETEAAVRLAASEAQQVVATRRKHDPSGDGMDGTSRTLMVPTQERMALFQRQGERLSEPQQAKAREQNHGWER